MKKNATIIRLHYDSSALSGRFRHVHAEYGIIMLTGGVARDLLRVALKKADIGGVVFNDYDFTVIGRGRYSKDRRPRGADRVEVEYGAPHKSLSAFFDSRDFTINQVAIDSKGYLYATKKAVRAVKNSVLELAHEGQPTVREVVRAIRFAGQYNLKVARNIREYIKEVFSNIKTDEELESLANGLWARYSRQFPMREYLKRIIR